ncbi:MAG TPA: GntR family transcriptional regulator [Caulobacteraceae bacterium]|nr:GntR family transcriptional regulator [Caulobacteraceae bacterium]
MRNRARDDVRGLLRDMIVAGELASDARVEEVDLASRIGVSRTPVREALIALEQEGLVRSRPHKGFTVIAADAALVRETYPILGALEIAAMRLAWPGLRDAVPELSELNRRLGAATSRVAQYECDRAFHARLTSDCGNARLLGMLERERTRAQRFDGAQKRGTADLTGSCAEHMKVVAALKAGKLEGATAVLQEHWDHGIEVVIGWLETSA